MKTLSLSKAFVFMALITCLGVMLSGCPKNIKLSNPNESIIPHTDSLPYKPDELVVWKKPSYSQVDFKNWLDTFASHYGTVDVHYYCASCDSTLVLLKGNGIKLLLEGVPPGGTGKSLPPKVAGGDGPAYISVNFNFRIPEQDSNNYGVESNPNVVADIPKFIKRVNYKHKDEVVVAVFDSGIDTLKLDDFAYQSTSSACLITSTGTGNANKGWNFADKNADLTDHDQMHHGSVVTKFIIDQAENYHNNPVRILPVKLFGMHTTATLFDVLCAFAYAKERGAKIINASFGFYTLNDQIAQRTNVKDEGLLLFKTFLKKNLDSANILLIAAAGNTNRNALNDFSDYYSTTNGYNNLDSIGFYPASLSGFASNIIAVTTIGKQDLKVSPNQNHSDSLVGIGVIADRGTVFLNPLNAQGKTVEGTSFATPIVAGKIAANYYQVKGFIRTQPTRDQLLQYLKGIGLISTSAGNTRLTTEIIDGNYTRK